MGRHSAPDDDEVDAATDTASGAVAVGEDPRTATPDGRHSSSSPEEHPEEHPAEEPADESGPDTGGLDLIEQALAGPDSGPMPVAAVPDSAPPSTPTAVEHEPADLAVSEVVSTAVSEVGVDSSGPVVATADAGEPAAAPTGPRRGTVGDVGLIRRHADVRARVIAAVVVPFVVFFAVFAVTGELSVRSLIWIWVPAVTAGVLVGLLLDAGHRRYPDAGPASATEPADPSPGPGTH